MATSRESVPTLSKRRLSGVILALGVPLLLLASLIPISTALPASAAPLVPAGSSPVRICYTTNLGDPYSSALSKLIKQEASYYGYKVSVFDIHNDIPTQLSDLDNCVAQHYSAIILQPYDPTALCPAVKAAYQAHIPMVNIENPLSQCTQYVTSFITDDGTAEGETSGLLMNQALHGHGNVIMIQGLLNNPIVPGRTNGFLSYVKQNAPGIKLIAKGVGAWNTAQSQALMNTYLTRFGASDIQGVYAEDSGMALGVITSLKEHNLTGKILVTSINGSNQEGSEIKAGTLYGTVLNSAVFVVRNSVQRIRDILDHVPVLPRYVMPALPITKANVSEFNFYW